MRRRDLLCSALWCAGAYTCSGSAFADGVLSGPGALGIGLEGDAAMIWPDSRHAAGDMWWLRSGQWLAPDMYAAFVRGRSGMELLTMLDAANHCLLRDALRTQGGGILAESRQRISAGEWRYLLYGTV